MGIDERGSLRKWESGDMKQGLPWRNHRVQFLLLSGDHRWVGESKIVVATQRFWLLPWVKIFPSNLWYPKESFAFTETVVLILNYCVGSKKRMILLSRESPVLREGRNWDEIGSGETDRLIAREKGASLRVGVHALHSQMNTWAYTCGHRGWLRVGTSNM